MVKESEIRAASFLLIRRLSLKQQRVEREL